MTAIETSRRINHLISGLTFRGAYEGVDNIDFNPENGDVIAVDGEEFVYAGNGFILIGGVPKEYYESNREKKKIRNCKNCGAPAGNVDRCEYCGSSLVED